MILAQNAGGHPYGIQNAETSKEGEEAGDVSVDAGLPVCLAFPISYGLRKQPCPESSLGGAASSRDFVSEWNACL